MEAMNLQIEQEEPIKLGFRTRDGTRKLANQTRVANKVEVQDTTCSKMNKNCQQ